MNITYANEYNFLLLFVVRVIDPNIISAIQMVMANSYLKSINHEGKEYASVNNEISVEKDFILKDFRMPDIIKIIDNTIEIHFRI